MLFILIKLRVMLCCVCETGYRLFYSSYTYLFTRLFPFS